MPTTDPSEFRPVIVAPTYNNGGTLGTFLDQLGKLHWPIIVVNDGSTDDTRAILEHEFLIRDSNAVRTITHHRLNLGKAAAIQTGFGFATSHNYTHALTIDTDGQHDVADAIKLLAFAEKSPNAFVIGARPIARGYPRASRVGRSISNLMIRLESGLKVSDSQCGLRVYPLKQLWAVRTKAGRYGFETEVITRAAWAGVEIAEVEIRCIYTVAGGRVSHFRPVLDSLHATRIHAGLLLRSLLRSPRSRLAMPRDPKIGTMLERLIRWLNPMTMLRDIRAGRGDGAFPASAAAGMMMAVLPLYGMKTALCLVLAKVLRLQPLVVLAISSANTPPTGPLLALASIATGHFFLHGSLPAFDHLNAMQHGWANTFRSVAGEWIVGSIIFGALMASLAYAAAWLYVRQHAKASAPRGASVDATAAWPATAPAASPPRS